MYKVLVLDNLSDEGVAVFEQDKRFEVVVSPPLSEDKLLEIIDNFDGIVLRSGTKVTAESLSSARRLRVIGRAGVGTDNIDKEAATNAGIVVMNTPGGNTISTCEHTFALLFALCRNIPPAHASMEAGKWERKSFMGVELHGKTLGLIGLGRIGAEVAKRARSFEMKLLGCDPILSKMKADTLGVDLVSLDALIERSDFISIHAPKNEKTVNLITSENLAKMKPTCRIINCARGGIVNESDLADALRNGIIAGAGLDVYSSEPLVDSPFIGLRNVVTTPHLAASTDEAQQTVAVDIAHQVIDFLVDGIITNAVNVPSIDAETHERVKPLLYLAERLGRFESSYMEGTPISLSIEYGSSLDVADTYPLTASIVMGFLEPMVESVNMISAANLLRDRGISCSETRVPSHADNPFQIRLTVVTDKESTSVAGRLYGANDPRICSVDDTRMDAVPEGWMVICMNEDKPLIIGRVATIIGEAGVNIANMTLGRRAPGGVASTILNLDTPLDAETLNKIRNVEHVNRARLVKL